MSSIHNGLQVSNYVGSGILSLCRWNQSEQFSQLVFSISSVLRAFIFLLQYPSFGCSKFLYLSCLFLISVYIRMLSCVRGVTIRQGMDCLDLLTSYTHHSELQAITVLPLIYTLYSSLLQTLASSFYYSLHCFLATDFNTGTMTVSLSYMLHISWYCSTCKVFSSQPDFLLHWTALNNSDASVPQFKPSAESVNCLQVLKNHYYPVNATLQVKKIMYWNCDTYSINSEIWFLKEMVILQQFSIILCFVSACIICLPKSPLPN
jgi:hypothetical protein